MTNIIFLTLKVFSATGGIEKVCRVAGKALYEMSFTGPVQTHIMSMHDQTKDADENLYFPTEIFEGFGAKKSLFVKAAVRKGAKADVVILSHINLLLVAWLIKKISPNTRIYLFAHGIEIWEPLKGFQKKMIGSIDYFLCVSSYTKDVIEKKHGFEAKSCIVLNNCLDPYLPQPQSTLHKPEWLAAMGLPKDTILLFTLTRLASKERYKGYDKVLEALAFIKDRYPTLRYLLGGSYDALEKEFVDATIQRLGLQDTVIITGYIPDADLASYFTMADIYVMPSKKEGFGIVFIEAMNYGLPVIAGNTDGSVDALLNGELGLLVNPQNVNEIKEALEKMITHPEAYQPDRKKLMEHFSFETYKRKLEGVLEVQRLTFKV